MKKYNSVFTIAVSIDHDKEDASDLTYEDLRNALQKRLDSLDCMNLPVHARYTFTGPDDTNENYQL